MHCLVRAACRLCMTWLTWRLSRGGAMCLWQGATLGVRLVGWDLRALLWLLGRALALDTNAWCRHTSASQTAALRCCLVLTSMSIEPMTHLSAAHATARSTPVMPLLAHCCCIVGNSSCCSDFVVLGVMPALRCRQGRPSSCHHCCMLCFRIHVVVA
ncbi:hypothetical protein COO60DRAFT_116101 [Scenedesmus sp. NREL 46B-D3]|nr:hypothetical protein COO60DRAFT_116101 [Scenedesmus sp. NREL 46B-D3]